MIKTNIKSSAELILQNASLVDHKLIMDTFSIQQDTSSFGYCINSTLANKVNVLAYLIMDIINILYFLLTGSILTWHQSRMPGVLISRTHDFPPYLI